MTCVLKLRAAPRQGHPARVLQSAASSNRNGRDGSLCCNTSQNMASEGPAVASVEPAVYGLRRASCGLRRASCGLSRTSCVWPQKGQLWPQKGQLWPHYLLTRSNCLDIGWVLPVGMFHRLCTPMQEVISARSVLGPMHVAHPALVCTWVRINACMCLAM